MPLTHSRTFRVRHYELDPYGHVNNAMYLRYMQETADEASAAAGFDVQRYAAMNRTWLIHETQIEYLRPLTYGDSVAVTTWVEDFTKVRSRRRYEFRTESDHELAARAFTDWAFMDTVSGRPAPIPPELIEAFFPDGAHPPALKRDPFPAAPPPPPGVFRMTRKVEWRDVNAAGHVNNATYLDYLTECAFEAAASFGWPAARAWAAGFGILARQHHVEYRRPAAYGDQLAIATWLSDMRSASVTRHFVITQAADDELVARVNSIFVVVDRATLRPTRIPPAFVADFAPNLAG